MFQAEFARPRRSGPMAAALSFHALLGGFLVVQPLVAFPETPDPSDKVKIIAVTFPHEAPPIHVDTVKPPAGGDGAVKGETKRPASGSPRPVPVQPQAIPQALPPANVLPGLDEPTGEPSGPFTPAVDPNAPSDGKGVGAGGPSVGAGEDPIFTPGPNVTMAVPISTPEPGYPDWARRGHIQGVVILEAVIGSDGRVRDVRVIRSLNPGMDRISEEAVRTWRYRPALVGGRPVSIYLTVSVRFNLN